MKPTYSIIISARNEEEAIAKVICSIPRSISRFSEVIVVDSSSKDLTHIIAKRLGVKVIKSNKGKGRTMRKGAEVSKGKVLIFVDGDGEHPPEYIPKLLMKLKDSNLVLGCRTFKKSKNDDFVLSQIFKIYSVFIRPMFSLVGFKVADPLSGFRVIRRHDWNRLDLKSNGFEIEAEMDIKALENGFIVKEVSIPTIKRGGGILKSHFFRNPKALLKILNLLIRYTSNVKIRNMLINMRKQFQY